MTYASVLVQLLTHAKNDSISRSSPRRGAKVTRIAFSKIDNERVPSLLCQNGLDMLKHKLTVHNKSAVKHKSTARNCDGIIKSRGNVTCRG